MGITQFKEIVDLLRSIADSSTANKIATISVVFSGIAVMSSIYFSYKTRRQYIESINPLLSFQLINNAGLLMLTMKNTGQSEAKDIKITFKNITNNGGKTDFMLDKLFENEITLYPNEKVVGHIAIAGANIATEISPVVEVEISYIKGNTKREEYYIRKVCYAGETDNPIEDRLRDINSKLKEISYSNNRMANYFSGDWLLTTDEMDLKPQRNLYQDMKDAKNSIERPEEDLLGRDENGGMRLFQAIDRSKAEKHILGDEMEFRNSHNE